MQLSNSPYNPLELLYNSLRRAGSSIPRNRVGAFASSSRLPLILFGLLCIMGGPISGQEQRPNLILLLTDDHRRDALGIYNSIVETPHLDNLAHRGVLFDQAFVTTSICMTSRASILTGQYARRHKIWDFQTPLSTEQLSQTYPALLKSAGYRIGFIGKWGVGEPPVNFFDFDRSFAGQGRYLMERNGVKRHLTSIMGDDAIEFLEGASPDVPFCLSISFKAPHVQDSYNLKDDPFPSDPALDNLYEDRTIPPPVTSEGTYFERLPTFLQNSENRMRWAVRFWGPDRYQESIKGYYRLVSGVDRVVGRIVDFLEQHPEVRDNTVILFTSDNGFFLGEFQLAGKWLAHDPSIRVPLILFDPREPESSGTRRDELVLNIDVAPTLLHLAGIRIPEQMQGRSLIPLLRNEEQEWRADFFYEHLFSHPRIPATEAVRTSEWKYIHYPDEPRSAEELYNLVDDAKEKNNLARVAGYARQLELFRARLASLRQNVE